MSYFSHYNDERRSPGILMLLLFSLASAVLGGLFVLYFGPALLAIPENNIVAEGDRWEYSDFPVVPFTVEDSPVIAIAETVGPAVVSISNLRGRDFFDNPITSSGSGVIFDKDNGYIVTNFHVIDGYNNIQVTVEEKRHYEAVVIGYDRETDLAVLQIPADNLPEARFGDSSKLRVGEPAIAIGNPLGQEFYRSVTVGVISALNREITVRGTGGEAITLQLVQTDAAINPGNSGGALVNSRGEVIGINSVKIARADVEGMGFAIPSDILKPIIDQLVDHGYVSRPFIGIYDFREITPGMSEWYDLPEGIYVGGVVEDGPAARAGMKKGDVIVQIQDDIVVSFADLQTSLKNYQVDDIINIVLVRNGKIIDLTVKLGEMPRR